MTLTTNYYDYYYYYYYHYFYCCHYYYYYYCSVGLPPEGGELPRFRPETFEGADLREGCVVVMLFFTRPESK